MMKICFILPIQSPYNTQRLKLLAQDADLSLTLLLEREAFTHRPGWQPSAIEGVTTHVLNSTIVQNTSSAPDLGYQIQGIRSIPWRLPLALLRIRPDIIVVCNATQLILSLPLRYLLHSRIALNVEDTPHATRNKSKLSMIFKCWAYRRADHWFAFSEDAKRFLHQCGIHNGISRSSWSLDMSDFTPTAINSVDPQTRPLTKQKRTVIFAGTLNANKGIRHLLESWSGLPSAIRANSKLLIAGSGPLASECFNYITKHNLKEVTMLGQLSYDDMRHQLQQADLLVLPTMQDLFSLTVLEAMACGCAVITTPYNGARELINDGVNGWIVNPTQPGALTAALERALSGQTDLGRMGRAARARVEHMDNTVVMSQFAQDLRDLAMDEQ